MIDEYIQDVYIILGFCLSYFFLSRMWRRRRLYYYASKVKGPISLLFLGSSYVFLEELKVRIHISLQEIFSFNYIVIADIFEAFIRLNRKYEHMYKLWLGDELCFVVSKHEDVRVVLKNAIEKLPSYKLMTPVFGNGLITLPGQ